MQHSSDPSAQDLFNFISTHLFTQGAQSVQCEGGHSFCTYRGDLNRTCAVGAIIPNSLYKPRMEGAAIDELLEEECFRFPRFFHDNVELLRRLQGVHDKKENWASTGRLRDALSDVAAEFNLSPSVLSSLELPK